MKTIKAGLVKLQHSGVVNTKVNGCVCNTTQHQLLKAAQKLKTKNKGLLFGNRLISVYKKQKIIS
jgi:G3E family GTPase